MAGGDDFALRSSELKTKRRRGILEVTKARSKAWKSAKTVITAEHYDLLPPSIPTYVNIDVSPSILPAKKYCDITGFPANYTDPKTKMRFATKEAFRMARNMPEHRVEEFLKLRHAQTRIK